jgi:hypothetical protein
MIEYQLRAEFSRSPRARHLRTNIRLLSPPSQAPGKGSSGSAYSEDSALPNVRYLNLLLSL